jgi:hypothetical protein
LSSITLGKITEKRRAQARRSENRVSQEKQLQEKGHREAPSRIWLTKAADKVYKISPMGKRLPAVAKPALFCSRRSGELWTDGAHALGGERLSSEYLATIFLGAIRRIRDSHIFA